MKNLFISVFLVTLLTYPQLMSGQGNNTSWLSADIGYRSSWILNQNMYGNQELDYSIKFSFSGAVSYKYFMSRYGYSLGLGIGSLGQNYKGEMAGANAVRKVNMTYLQLPVLGMYKLGGYNQKSWVAVGPQLMCLLSAQQDFDRKRGGRATPNPEMMILGKTDITNRFNLFDVMLAFEYVNVFSYEYTEKIKWFLSFNGGIGLTDINKKGYRIPNTHNVYGGSHNFYVGIRFGMMSNPREM